MHKYETVLVFQADLEEVALNALVESVETLINSVGELTKIDRWGKTETRLPPHPQTI